jgi:hypothetical protein
MGLCAFLAAAALAVSLTHRGPPGQPGPAGARGPAGPQGNTGRNAQTARLGICWNASYQNSGGVTWVNAITLSPASLVGGVYVCDQGTFVSIVPSPGP